MGRMLKALQQIEAKQPQPPPQPPENVPAEKFDVPAPSLPENQLDGVFSADKLGETAFQDVQAPVTAIVDPPLQWPGMATDEHARAYGKLADELLKRLPDDGGVSLMFTSPGDGDGKTRTLVPLAAALVERVAGEVLVVDGNLRKPDLAGSLGAEPRWGWADVLMGVTSWRQVVRKTVVQRLDVLPGVQSPPSGQATDQIDVEPLLEELCGVYQLVLIDTASLAHAEVAPMARYCNGTYLVVRLHHTARCAAAESLKVIEACQGRLLGSILLES